MAECTKTLLFVQIFSYVLLLSHPQQESSFVKFPTMPYLSHKSLPPQWDKERGFHLLTHQSRNANEVWLRAIKRKNRFGSYFFTLLLLVADFFRGQRLCRCGQKRRPIRGGLRPPLKVLPF